MAEEIQGQGQTPPAEGQASPEPVLEYQGQQYSPNDFVSKHDAAVRAMNEAQQRAAEAEKQVEEFRSWAPAVQERYEADPDGFNSWYRGVEGQPNQAPPNALDPAHRQLEQQSIEIKRLKMERDLDNLAASGLEMTRDMRQEVAREVYVSGIEDVEAVYKKLYFDRAQAQARENAVSDTADRMNRGRQYNAPPAGNASPQAPVDISKLSKDEKRSLAMERIQDMPFYNE